MAAGKRLWLLIKRVPFIQKALSSQRFDYLPQYVFLSSLCGSVLPWIVKFVILIIYPARPQVIHLFIEVLAVEYNHCNVISGNFFLTMIGLTSYMFLLNKLLVTLYLRPCFSNLETNLLWIIIYSKTLYKRGYKYFKGIHYIHVYYVL